jgi:hypothetical protein
VLGCAELPSPSLPAVTASIGAASSSRVGDIVWSLMSTSKQEFDHRVSWGRSSAANKDEFWGAGEEVFFKAPRLDSLSMKWRARIGSAR